MRRVLGFLLLAAISVALAWWVATLAGQVAIRFGSWSIEAPLPIFLLLLAVLILLCHWLLRLLGGARRLPGRIGLANRHRHLRLGQNAITQTLLALAAGDAAKAEAGARKARGHLGETPQTLLLAAEAARLGGREDRAEADFRTLAGREDAAFLGLRGLLRQAIAREDWTEAALLARRAEAAYPGAAWLRAERAQLALRTGDWGEALALAGPDSPRAALAAGAAAAETDPARARRLARQAWKADRGLTPAALTYAGLLRQAGKERSAQSVLRETWALAPHPDLATLALAPLTAPLDRARAAQRFVAGRDDAESHFLLARTALAAELTGEAQRQLDAAMAAGLREKRAWLLRAAIAEAEAEAGGADAPAARDAQRAALREAAQAPADAAWRCHACHAEAAQWQPACPACHSAGSLRWESAALPTAAVPTAAIAAATGPGAPLA